MDTDEISALHYRTNTPIKIKWHGNTITEVEEIQDFEENLWVAPPLLDLQVNGFAGIDFQNPSIHTDELLAATNALHNCCCAKYFLTLITDDWERMMEKLKHIKAIRDKNDILKNSITGWHIEGPFLSDKPGFCGTHNPGFMIDPTEEHIRQLRNIIPDDPILVTIAPERKNAIPAIRLACELGITVSLGHSDAPAEILIESIKAGAKGFTHLGNGCPSMLDRKDNILWRVLDLEKITISLIPDTIHVSPPLFRLIHKLKKDNEIFYVSDAVSGAGAPPGDYSLGDIKITVSEDGTIWNPAKTGYAGSSLRPFDGILRGMKMLGCNWQEVWARYSEIPASFSGVNNELAPGATANFVVLKTDANNLPVPVKIVVCGEEIFKN